MSKASAICEEFCDRLQSSTRNIASRRGSYKIEKLKCALDQKYFLELFVRLRNIGYCCTQVDKHPEFDRCIAWFESLPHVQHRK